MAMQLTHVEACMSPTAFQAHVRAAFQDYLARTASALETVQVKAYVLDVGDEKCGRRRAVRRTLLAAAFSSATAEVWLSASAMSGPEMVQVELQMSRAETENVAARSRCCWCSRRRSPQVPSSYGAWRSLVLTKPMLLPALDLKAFSELPGLSTLGFPESFHLRQY